MANEDNRWNSQAWPFWSWPAGMLDALKMPASAGAPQSLTQPILPWVFAHSISVNEHNSSCPEMEREIVAQESYGRQLGRVINALEALIQERPGGAPQNEEIEDFLALSRKIRDIKAGSSATRIRRLEADLAWLEANSPGEYQRIASKFSLHGKGRR
ncbi:MAG: hypothetical protein JWP79_536 [Polaromonas sp.]|jgi:hypothetical protein|nr:hypothetical protein [Polaromonas sp.]MDB5843226.1 hypothetical protein [Polaromonas sp.]